MTSMTTFDKNSSNEHGISLCIPFVFKHITKEKIFAVIRAQRVGHIERIDIVNKDAKHNRVYVHFARSRWGNPSNITYSKIIPFIVSLIVLFLSFIIGFFFKSFNSLLIL